MLATLYFNVTSGGTANVTISNGLVFASSSDPNGTAVTTNKASITVNVPPPLFSDGFESGNFNAWDLCYGWPSTVAPNATNTLAHTGNYSAYFPAKSVGQIAFLTKSVSAQQTLDLRFYMNLATAGSGYFEVAEVDASNHDSVAVNLNLAAGTFEVGYYNCSLGSTFYFDSAAQSIPANSWLCLELAVNNATFTLYYNGAAMVSGAFPNGPTANFNRLLMASIPYSAAGVPAYYIDDVVAANQYIGP